MRGLSARQLRPARFVELPPAGVPDESRKLLESLHGKLGGHRARVVGRETELQPLCAGQSTHEIDAVRREEFLTGYRVRPLLDFFRSVIEVQAHGVLARLTFDARRR